jgi:hypothetical protein
MMICDELFEVCYQRCMMLWLHGGASISGVLSFLVMMRLSSVIQTVKYSHYFLLSCLTTYQIKWSASTDNIDHYTQDSDNT